MTQNLNTHKHIFIVDDDPEDREMFSEALSFVSPDAQLTEISSGVNLIQTLNNPDAPVPEVIFLDMNMPKLTGIDCLKKIKASDSKFKDMKIVILSTYSNKDEIEEAFKQGANRYYVKPTLFDNLKDIISGVLETNWKKTDFHTKEHFFVNYATT